MLTIAIPGGATLHLAHLVLDYNGTLALDGNPLPGVKERLVRLASQLTVHVITADTHGTVRQMLAGLDLIVHVIPPQAQDRAKEEYICRLGQQHVVAMGNGRNDSLMLARAALGICLLQEEGACTQAMQAAELCCRDIPCALDLLLLPKRLQATLRR